MGGGIGVRTPWFYGWTVVATCMIFQVLTVGMYGVFTFFVGPWTEEFNATRAEILLAISVAHICMMLGGAITGPLMDRKPIRVLIAIGLGIMAVGFVFLSLAQSKWQAVALFAISLGVCLPLAGILAGQTLAAKWFRARRGLAIGIVSVGTNLSTLLLVPVVTGLLAAFGWRGTFLGLAAIAAAMVPMVLVLIRNSPEEMGLEPDAPEPDVTAASAPRLLSAREILSSPNFWFVGLAFVAPVFAMAAFVSNLAPFADDLGLMLNRTAIVAQLLSFLGIFSILFGRLADRFDLRILVFVIIGLQAAGYLLLLHHPGYPRLLAATTLIALGNAGFFPVLGAILGRCFGAANFGRVMGFVMMLYLVGAAGAPIAGQVRDGTGTYDPFFLTLAIAVAVSPLLILGLRLPSRGALAVAPSAALEKSPAG